MMRIQRSQEMRFAVLAEETQCKPFIITLLAHEEDVLRTLLLAQVDRLAEVLLRISQSLPQAPPSTLHLDAQLVEAGVGKFFAVVFSTQLSDFSEGGAEFCLKVLLQLAQFVRTGSPELVLGLSSQPFDADAIEFHPLFAVGCADLQDLIHCCHVVRRGASLLGVQFHEQSVQLAWMDVLDGFGVATRPLAEGGGEGRADLGGTVQEGGLAVVETLLDAVAGQQQVQHHLLVLLLLVNEAQQVPHSSRVSTNPAFLGSPVGLPDQVQEEQGLGMAELEEPCDILEDSEDWQIVKAVALSGHDFQNWQDVGHFPSLVELGGLVAQRNGRGLYLCIILLHNYLIISLQEWPYLRQPP